VVPTAALPSLQIDGGTTFTDVFAHPFLPGYTAIRHNLGGTARQHTITCDSAFTAITYGLGSVESYGYNAGTLVKNLNALPNITNTFNTSGGTNDYTCAKTPFKFSIWLSVKPTTLTWQFSQVANLSPNTDVVQNNPAPVDSVFNNGRWFYKFTLTQDYLFSQTGAYNVPILITHPSIEGCNNSFERLLTVNVIAAPIVNFATTFSGCVGDAVQFAGSGNSANGVTLTTWNWNFGDNTTGTGQNTTKIYTAPGTYQVNMRAIGTDGCVGDTTKPVVVNARPTVNVVNDSLATCPGSNVTFTVQNPAANTTYNWYTVATGGTSIHTGTSYTANNITATTVFFVEAVQNGCASTTRRRVVASIRPALTVPVVAVDSLGTNMVRFRWNAVPNATGYEVSINGGTTWITPSSGATGLTHTITGLQPLQQVSLIVRALGGCQEVRSLQASAQTLPDDIYIPNAFTPNGDGLNDVLRVYGYVIQDIQFSVFNQWGEKIFESRNQNTGWDGRYKGKDQPSGVYMYVCRIVLRNGTTIYRKGSINLIR
jgi:trimeric autotransporter adhesin